MKVFSTETEKVLKLLAATPRRIASLSQGIDIGKLQFKPDQDSWSANEILAHLRACADVWGKSIIAIITLDHPTLRHISPRGWIRRTDYLQLEFKSSLATFAQQRHELLSVLKGLATRDWSRAATTKGREETVLSYASRMAEHENKHCGQIEEVLKLASAPNSGVQPTARVGVRRNPTSRAR